MIGSKARRLLLAALLAGGFAAVPADAVENVWGGKACNFQTTQFSENQFAGSLRVGPVVAPTGQSITIRCLLVDGSTGAPLADSQPQRLGQGQAVQQSIAYSRPAVGGTRLLTYVTVGYTDGSIGNYDANQANCTNVGLFDTRGQNAITILRQSENQTIGIIDPGCF